MTARRTCPAAPGPLEEYTARFDDLFTRLAQRRGFREYLTGLLAPRDRSKTLTALAGAEPLTGAQHPAVQRLHFLSESRWDPDHVNDRRLELLAADPATAAHGGGVLVIDDSGDRKDGVETAHVGRHLHNIPGSGIAGVPGSHHPKYIDTAHREHAVVETAGVRTAKAMGLRNLPSKTWQVNVGWVIAANIAADLTAWTRLLGFGDDPDLREADPETLRYRI